MKRIILLVTTALLSAMLLVSCSIIPTEKPEEKEPENLIYNGNVELQIVIADGIETSSLDDIWQAIGDACGAYPQIVYDTSEATKHEIVVGRTDREISGLAYKQLERMQKDKESDNGVIAYSDGSSLAIAYDDDEYGVTLSAALSLIAEKYVKAELTVASGVAYSDSFDVIEKINEAESAERAKMWEKFAEKLGSNGEDIAKAFSSFYDIYSVGMLRWVANLYDPDICVCKEYYGLPACTGEYELCGTAGFHYTSSARDTIGYLPVVEAMHSVMNLTVDVGLTKDYTEYFPDEIKAKMADFVYYLQDPDGYFYHPQWGKDVKTARISRDLSWCTTLLAKFGRTSRYPTIADIPEVEPASFMTGRLGRSAISAVSYAVAADSETRIPAHLLNLDAFVAYLESLNFETGAYGAGSEVNTQMSQIKARDRQTGEPFLETLGEFLDSKQQENGLWHAEVNYYGVNGLMKISGIYSGLGREIPRVEKSIEAAIHAIISEEAPGGIVDVWNPWSSLSKCLNNVKAHKSPEEADRIRADMFGMMDDAITASKSKLGIFLKADGSFSYLPNAATSTMQGAPCSVPGINEGDMDGVALAVFMLDSINIALGSTSYAVPLFGTAESIEFMDIIKNASPVIKHELDVTIGEATTFDFEDEGPLALGNVTAHRDTVCNIVPDPRENSTGNVLYVEGSVGVTEGVIIKCDNPNTPSEICYVFESDFCFKEKQETSDNLRIMLGNGTETASAHVMIFKHDDLGVYLWEISSVKLKEAVQTDLGFFAEYGEWFKVRVEYYPGDHDSVRIKIFVNDILYAVTDNYYDFTAKKTTEAVAPNNIFNQVRMYIPKQCDPKFYMDNIKVYKSQDTYKKETVETVTGINVDSAPNDEKIYTFDENYDDITITGANSVMDKGGDKQLYLAKDSYLTLKQNKTQQAPNCVSVSFELDTEELISGDILTVSLADRNPTASVMCGFTFVSEIKDGVVTVTAKDSVKGAKVPGFSITVDGSVTVRIDYYEDDRKTLFYADGKMCGMSAATANGAELLVVGSATITANQDVYIDELVCSHISSSLDEVTAPKLPSITHGEGKVGFDSIVVSDGVEVRTEGSDSYLYLDTGKGYHMISVPVNKRDEVESVTLASMAIRFDSAKVGKVYELLVNDGEGYTVISFSLYSDGENVYLRERTEYGEHKANCATVKIGAESTLSLEYFALDGICKISLDGKCVFATSLYYSQTNRYNSPTALVLESATASSTLSVDALRAETYNGFYTPVELPAVEEEGVLTFDYAGVDGIPSSINGTRDRLSIAETLNKDGDADKALKLDAISGSGQRIVIYPYEAQEGANCFIFDADLCYGDTEDGVRYEIAFREGDDSDAAAIGYRLLVVIAGDEIYIQDGDDKTARYRAAYVGEWFNLHAEYYVVGEDEERSIRVKVYLDGELAYTADSPWRSTVTGELQLKENIDRVELFANKATEGASYYDDLGLVGTVKDYVE